LIGRRLSHFEITAKLGEGGMGEVYRARDARLGREVAIKVLPRAFVADAERLARFEREARVLASLEHPNVAAIHELGQDGEVRFLVMELVAGETLAERLERGPLPVEEALDVALQVAAALDAAHRQGIVHRDLKPGNVMIDDEDRVKLLDFGLGKVMVAAGDDDEAATPAYDSTLPGALIGTPGYMSPEQVRGRPVDSRADLWALGVVVWEMLTGRRLFRGVTPGETLAAVLDAEVDFAALPPATPPAVRRWLERLLVRDAERRLRHPGDAWLLLDEAVRQVDEDERAAAASAGSFRLTIEICRQLHRGHLVPEMLGDDVPYLDNRRDSDVLVVCLPGIGGDHEQFREVIERSPFRALSVSPYGWAEGARWRLPLPLRDHLTILRRVFDDAVRRLRPRFTVLSGFSSGGDLALRLPLEGAGEVTAPDAVLAIGPNLSLRTCFYTARLAAIRSESPDELLASLREIGASAETLEEWLLLQPFLFEVAKRFHAHVPALRLVARGIVEPFEADGTAPFAEWYRALRQRGIAVRALFCGTSFDLEGLSALRMAHLESAAFGPDFAEADLVEYRERTHMQLLDPELVTEHVRELLAAAG
jgi:hypothetical protein